jgi:alkylation response protein AidB-like acyl-CoA dehydrogenase
MNAPTSPVTENVADLDSGATENEFPNGDDLAISRATDFYCLDELLTDQEREMRDRVRLWCDTEVAPAAAGYWERAEFPVELAKGYGRLGIAGASIVGNGCPGVSFLAEGVIAAELARGDGSIATLNAVHSGLAMTTIAMLGSEEQQAQYLPRMATCEILGAFALTEPKHGSDVVALETRARRQGASGCWTGRSGGSATAPSPTWWSSGPGTTTTARSVLSSWNTRTARSTRSPGITPGRSSAKQRTAARSRPRSAWTGCGCPPVPV